MELIGRSENLAGALLPARGIFAVPGELTPQQTPKLTAGGPGKALDLFHQTNPDGPRFRLLETRYGFHMVPDTVRDEHGDRVRGSSVLDVNITVPEAVRTAGAHILALCDAVGSASGIKLHFFGMYTDQYYAFNGLIPDKNTDLLGTAEQLRPFSFAWGASAVPARDALISLLENSATTLTWSLMCAPSASLQNRDCFLNLGPITVAVTGPDGNPTSKFLMYDRCLRCPSLAPPAPLRRQQ
jgi:hypothetical protein